MPDQPRIEISRRSLLVAGAGGLSLLAVGGLAACSSPSAGPAPSGSGVAGSPTRGGRLRIGIIGGGASEVISPYAGPTSADHSRTPQVYDTLLQMTPDAKSMAPGLAEELTMNADFTVMTIRLREGVVFHDGKPLGADDVVWNFQEWAQEGNRNYTTVGFRYKPSSVRAVDGKTVEIKLDVPVARPQVALTWFGCGIAPKGGSAPGTYNGTGPFVVQSFTPGQRSLMSRNPNYWREGQPYVDELEIISFSDPDAMVNALRGGEVDGVPTVPNAQIASFKGDSSFTVLEADSPTNTCFLMRTDRPPFDDVRVRQAMKLIPIRQQLVDVALQGYGKPGNDLFGPGLPFFDETVPVPEQDIDQARSLLNAAGYGGGLGELTLHTAAVANGMVESAVLLAEQANQTGLMHINVKKEDPAAYYDPTQLWMKVDFGQTDCAPVTNLSSVYLSRTKVFNETHWDNEQFNTLLAEADRSPDDVAAEKWIEAQRIWREESGYIVWNSLTLLDVVRANVQGLVPYTTAPMANYTFVNAWLS